MVTPVDKHSRWQRRLPGEWAWPAAGSPWRAGGGGWAIVPGGAASVMGGEKGRVRRMPSSLGMGSLRPRDAQSWHELGEKRQDLNKVIREEITVTPL